jgi:preprotein translocase subunit YajC
MTNTHASELADISSEAQTPVKANSRRLTFFLSPLWFCLIITLVLRIWFIFHTQAFIDGDEAIAGIQAQHILHGEFPIYYYGQPYMGSLEAYFIALLFAIFGIATWVMRIEPILLSLVLVWLTWKLAGALAELAKLTKSTKTWFQTIAGLFAAIPPLYDGIIEMRTWGGHIEIYILMLALLYTALRLTQRWQRGALLREIGWRWAGIGFLVGLSLWIYPLGITAIVATIVWIVGFFFLTLRRIQRHTEQEEKIFTVKNHFQRLVLALLALPASLVGFTPALIYGVNNNWANILYLLSPGNNDSNGIKLQHLYPTRLALLQATTILYSKCSAPRVIGGALSSTSYLQTFLFASIGACAILFTAGIIFFSFHQPTQNLQRLRSLVGLPALFGLLTALVFCVSNISAAGLLAPCTRDEVGRYAAPLHLALPFFFATVFIAIHYFLEKRQIQKQKADQENNYKQITANTFSPQTKGIIIFLCVCCLGINLFQYVRTKPADPFQSFACHYAPINDDVIIAYMQNQHIADAWATMWIGNMIVFKTQEQIHVADPRIITVAAANRLPYNTTIVSHANNPSILAFDIHGDPKPDLLKALDADHVTYKLARFPGSNGVDVMVITPINRAVSPSEGNSLGSWAYGC